MTMFKTMLQEAVDELEPVKDTNIDGADATAEVTPPSKEEVKTDEETDEGGPEEAKEGTVQRDVQDIITSILDAVEAESLASGEVFNDDESVDIGLELIYKIASKLDDADAKLIYDELSEYFEMEVDEKAEGEEDEFFEEPATPDGADIATTNPTVPAAAVTEGKRTARKN